MRDTTVSLEATDRTMRESALVAGVGLLLMAVLAGIANFAAIERLVTEGDATKTAQDILSSQGSFRSAMVALVLVAVLDVIVAWALFGFFKPVHEGVSRLAAWLRVAYAAVFAVAISQLVGTLRLLSNADYLKTFSAAQLRTEALLKINAFHDIWSISLVFFGLYLLLIGGLAYRSGYVPKFVGVLLVIAGLGYLMDSFGALLVANYSLKAGAFTSLGEVVLMIWLLVKGRGVTARAPLVRQGQAGHREDGPVRSSARGRA
jgi:Domain of unknown function (DUF4386)